MRHIHNILFDLYVIGALQMFIFQEHYVLRQGVILNQIQYTIIVTLFLFSVGTVLWKRQIFTEKCNYRKLVGSLTFVSIAVLFFGNIVLKSFIDNMSVFWGSDIKSNIQCQVESKKYNISKGRKICFLNCKPSNSQGLLVIRVDSNFVTNIDIGSDVSLNLFQGAWGTYYYKYSESDNVISVTSPAGYQFTD